MSKLGLMAAVVLLLTSSIPAIAQLRCPEGRTAKGECVNPGLAQVMRERAVVFTQPKLSYTSPPVMPADDREYLLTRQFQEFNQFFFNPPRFAP